MRDPGSKWAPLPEAGAPDGYVKTQFIVHSTGDTASADRIRNYFAQTGVVVESTFIVGVTSDDPTLQIMDSTDNADANLKSNQRAIAVEVVGDGTGPFTEWQVKEIIRLGRWAADNHPIQRRICPTYTLSGFGWHVMFGAPGPWTTVNGKICPGPVRIDQLKNRIFPAIFSPEDDMPLTTADAKLVVKELLATVLTLPDKTTAKVSTLLTTTRQAEKSLQADTDDIQAKQAEQAARLAAVETAVVGFAEKLDGMKPVDEQALAGYLASLINKG
jgi:hypothetical protein